QKIQSASGLLARLQDTQAKFDPKFLSIPNRLGYAWSNLQDKINPGSLDPQSRQDLANFVAFRRDGVANLSQYLNELSGAAITPQEFTRLSEALPNPGTGVFDGDGPTEFKAKYDASVEQAQHALMRANYASAHGLNPLSSGIALSD